MIPIAIKLFMGGLLKRVTGAFVWAVASTTRMLTVALCVSLACNLWLWRGWNHEQDGRKADKAGYVAAQIEATEQATQAKARQELDDEQRKKDSDDALKLDMASDRRRADDYAIRNRVRRQAAPGPTSSPDLPETGPAAQGDNGPGDVAELVGITRADFDICTVNSRRLSNVHDWALTADRVIPEVAFGGE